MELIEKDALVAEIEELIADETESIKSFERRKNISEVQRSNARIGVLKYIRSSLDTLETREVDLDFEKELYKAFGQIKDFTLGMHIAKHFFELGLKARKEKEGMTDKLEFKSCHEVIDTVSVGRCQEYL